MLTEAAPHLTHAFSTLQGGDLTAASICKSSLVLVMGHPLQGAAAPTSKAAQSLVDLCNAG